MHRRLGIAAFNPRVSSLLRNGHRLNFYSGRDRHFNYHATRREHTIGFVLES
jgi:hypothetical protein